MTNIERSMQYYPQQINRLVRGNDSPIGYPHRPPGLRLENRRTSISVDDVIQRTFGSGASSPDSNLLRVQAQLPGRRHSDNTIQLPRIQVNSSSPPGSLGYSRRSSGPASTIPRRYSQGNPSFPNYFQGTFGSETFSPDNNLLAVQSLPGRRHSDNSIQLPRIPVNSSPPGSYSRISSSGPPSTILRRHSQGSPGFQNYLQTISPLAQGYKVTESFSCFHLRLNLLLSILFIPVETHFLYLLYFCLWQVELLFSICTLDTHTAKQHRFCHSILSKRS